MAGGGYSKPTVTTQAVSDIDSTYATGNGTVTNAGVNYSGDGYVIGGICFGTVSWTSGLYPPYSNSQKWSTSTGIGAYNVLLTGMMPNTTYYATALAYNNYDVAYGSQVSFTTTGSSGFVDQQQTISNTVINPYTYSGTSKTVYQSFVAGSSGLLLGISVLTYDFNKIHAQIYTDNGSNSPSVLLAEDANLFVSVYAYENYQWRDISFSSPPSLVSGNKYWIKLTSEGTSTNTALFQSSNLDSYTDGKMYYYAASGGAWTEATNIDLAFKTYMLLQSSIDGDILVGGNAARQYMATRNSQGTLNLSGEQLRKLIAYREISG